MPSKDTHYKVYLAAYLGGNPGTDHHAIYVESVPGEDEDPNDMGSGCLFHSVGSTLFGMSFERKEPTKDPRLASTGKRITPIGWVSHDKFRDEFEAVCRRVPLPHRQYTLAGQIYRNIPIRHCQHWALNAIHALCVASVLEPLTSSDSLATLERID